MKDVVLQKVLFPTGEKLENHTDMFYKGPRIIKKNNIYEIPKGTVIDFASYMNGFPINKWTLYTDLQNLSLQLTIKGRFRCILTGYNLEPEFPVRYVIHSSEYLHEKAEAAVISYPALSYELVAFEIEALDDCWFVEGCYTGKYQENQIRDINLAIATTTFKKEDYITHNIELIKDQLLDSDDDISRHLFVNVVDNGRTLSKEQIELSDHIRLFYNDNVGGSGGFSRGMYESVHMTPEITNVLLMDDDVLIFPESIRRTYTLLTVLNEKYQKAFISGAMFNLDQIYLQWEDVAVIQPNRDFLHAKPAMDMRWLDNVLRANRPYPHHRRMYAGWWYCCIPAETIKEKGFALPLFIRGDDMDYGIRCHPKFITMSGICLWHMSFNGKYNASQNFYQEYRNIFIVKSASGNLDEVDVLTRWKNECYRAAMTYDYGGWELLLLALEDYLKGPDFIKVDRGTELLARNKPFCEKMEPLENFTQVNMVLDEVWEGMKPMTFLQRVRYYRTWNGQKWTRDSSISDEIGIMRYDWDHRPDKCGFKKYILAVDFLNRKGHLRTRDRQKFKELYARQKRDLKQLKQDGETVRKAYRDQYSYLTSEEFWKKYLKLG